MTYYIKDFDICTCRYDIAGDCGNSQVCVDGEYLFIVIAILHTIQIKSINSYLLATDDIVDRSPLFFEFLGVTVN